MKILILILALSSLCCNTIFTQVDSLPEVSIYVWGFSTASEESDQKLANALIFEFEKALVHQQIYTVLERNRLARLLTQYENELTIHSLGDISERDIELLELEKAEVVCFGEFFLHSGKNEELRLTVSVQNFKGAYLAIESVNIKNDKLEDFNYIQNRMNKLANRITDTLFPDLDKSLINKSRKLLKRTLGRGH